VSFEATEKAAEQHAAESTTCTWITSTLENRIVTATGSEKKPQMAMDRDCPQCVVLPLLLWNLMVVKLNEGTYYAVYR
jgi:hypothetical protein